MVDAALVLFLQTLSPLAALVGWDALILHFDAGTFFRIISILGSALTAFKLYRAGLHRRYRMFFAYLVFRIPCMSCGLFLDTSGAPYLWLFTKSEPVIMLFYVLIVLELYRLVLHEY